MSSNTSYKATSQYLFFVTVGFMLNRARLSSTQIVPFLSFVVIVPIGYMVSRLMAAAYIRRELILLDDTGEKEFLGLPLLFSARLSHARRFPVIAKYNYWYDYFMVGIPVGLRGRIGSLLSVDNLPASERHKEKCWFTIDPTYYLDRGSGDRCLREKLNIFLQSIGEDPRQFPYAYLFSVPRFLWWQKSAISYWYLYSPSKDLTAMIMEINNSFYEKRNVFFRLTGDSHIIGMPEATEVIFTGAVKRSSELHELHFLSSMPRSKHYKGSWDKHIFASPFEKVEGSMAATFVDPLQPDPNPKGPLQSTLSSLAPDGQMKVTSRLSSWAQPVNPISGSSWDIARLLLCWTHVGLLSSFRIVKEALRVRFKSKLEYLKRPEIRRGSISRKETAVERVLERSFREYLSQLTCHCPYPLTVIYSPPKSLHFDPIYFHSLITTQSSPRTTLTVQPLTPHFYTRITHYAEAHAGFSATTKPCPTKSDPSSCYLWISDYSVMSGLLDAAQPSLARNAKASVKNRRRTWSFKILKAVIARLRKSDNETFMDHFTYHSLPYTTQNDYQKAQIHHLLAGKLPMESPSVILLCYIAMKMAVVYIFLSLVHRSLEGRFDLPTDRLFALPRTGALLYGGWVMHTQYVGKYYTNPFAWGEGL